MLLRGVIFHPSQFENLFVSLVHTDADVDQTLAAAAEVFPILAAEKAGRAERRQGRGEVSRAEAPGAEAAALPRRHGAWSSA